MFPFKAIGDATIVLGDALRVLRVLPDRSVDFCMTSPPYWGLRDYRVKGQYGLERTLGAYIEKMVEVFGEVWRVLKKRGTCWVNIGDCYAGSWGGSFHSLETRQAGLMGFNDRPPQSFVRNIRECTTYGGGPRHGPGGRGLKPKDMVGVPWTLAFALRDAGWWLRQDIIWHKPNVRPESAKDRFTKAHEYVFLLAKARRYYFNAEAVREPMTKETVRNAGNSADHDYLVDGRGEVRSKFNIRDNRSRETCFNRRRKGIALDDSGENHGQGTRGRLNDLKPANGTRNRRSVWTIAPGQYYGPHFACYPERLVEPCILAGCPPGGMVLDPFQGKGTTGVVALRLGREYVGIDINPEYHEIAEEEIVRAWATRPALLDGQITKKMEGGIHG